MADGVTMTGFTMTGSGKSRDIDAGIRIEADDVYIGWSHLHGNEHGILIIGSSGTILSNNNCSNNIFDGINMRDVEDITVTNSICSDNVHGITLRNSNANTFLENTCTRNEFKGILVEHYSSNNSFSNVSFWITKKDNQKKCN